MTFYKSHLILFLAVCQVLYQMAWYYFFSLVRQYSGRSFDRGSSFFNSSSLGKTPFFLSSCAFGMEACKQYYNTRYVRMPDLLMDLDIARTEGNYRKVMAKYSNPVLLILDEWMLLKPTDTEQKDIFELLHRRRKKSSTIFCSQYIFEEWYDQLGGEDSPLADAIIDRIAHDSYQINITSINAEHDRFMREVYGLDKSMRE